jgi:hypothetical protein
MVGIKKLLTSLGDAAREIRCKRLLPNEVRVIRDCYEQSELLEIIASVAELESLILWTVSYPLYNLMPCGSGLM